MNATETVKEEVRTDSTLSAACEGVPWRGLLSPNAPNIATITATLPRSQEMSSRSLAQERCSM